MVVLSACSIFCYDCNSAYDPRCGEEFDPFSLGVVNCSLKDPIEHIPPVESKFCRSIKMESQYAYRTAFKVVIRFLLLPIVTRNYKKSTYYFLINMLFQNLIGVVRQFSI